MLKVRSRIKKLKHKLAVYYNYCPIKIHNHQKIPFSSVHRFCNWGYFTNKSLGLAFSAQLILLLIWPLRASLQTLSAYLAFAKQVLEQGASTKSKLLIDVWLLAIFKSVPPRMYFRYRLFERQESVDHWLLDHQISALFPKLNNYAVDMRIRDKQLFRQFCLQHGFAHPANLDINKEQVLPEQFIIKPKSGNGGRGFMLIKRHRLGWQLSDDIGTVINTADLAETINVLYGDNFIIQKQLLNHSAFSFIASSKLVTLRIFTGWVLQEQGNRYEVEALHGVLFIPKPGQQTSNNGYLVQVDLLTGELGNMHSRKPLSRSLSHYPGLNKKVAGTCLPYIDNSVDLAMRAHAHFNRHVFLAWDIAITQQGAVLLEANENFDIAAIQITMQCPVGSTALGKACLHHCKL